MARRRIVRVLVDTDTNDPTHPYLVMLVAESGDRFRFRARFAEASSAAMYAAEIERALRADSKVSK